MSERSPHMFRSSRGSLILKKLFNLGNRSSVNSRNSTQAIDTYKSLKNLKDMVKSGNITQDEYEAIKLELLLR